MSKQPIEDIRSDRDALALIGLLARAFMTWDPPVASGLDPAGKPDFTHFAGLNIHAALVDNVDGELLALGKNTIHEAESPVEHAEQHVIRSSIDVLRAKRPRRPGESVEAWYRARLFYGPGNAAADFVTSGCTLYTTLEPCPMCAATTLVSRIKRVVYVIPDAKFGGSWAKTQADFYSRYDLQFGRIAPTAATPVSTIARELLARLDAEVAQLRTLGLQDTWFLDRMHPFLESVLDALLAIDSSMVLGAENERLLDDLRHACRLPK